MEIIDFLRGRWLAIAIAAPVLAGAIAYLLFSGLQEDRYEASGQVAVAAVAVDDLSPDQIDVYVQSFLAYLESTDTQRAVADQIGVTLAEAEASLDASETGADLVEVTFVADGETSATDGLTAAVGHALSDVAARDVRRIEGTVANAQSRVDDLRGRLLEIQDEAGTPDVAGEHALLSSQIFLTRNQIAQATVNDPSTAAELTALLTDYVAEREVLEPFLVDHEAVSASLQQAQADLAAAEARLALSQDLGGTSATSEALSSVRVGVRSSLADVARATVVAMLGALVAVFVAAFVLRRRETAAASAPVEPGAPAWGDGHDTAPLGPPHGPPPAPPGPVGASSGAAR